MTNFLVRLLSSVVLAAVALAAVIAGPPWLTLMVALAVGLMAREWPELCLAGAGARPLWRPAPPPAAVGFVAVVAVAMVLLALEKFMAAIGLALGGGLVIAALLRARPAVDRVLLGAGAPYIVVPAAAVLWLGGEPREGTAVLVALLITVWATDIGGYLAGKAIGGPKLAPAISPQKTLAGVAGAVMLAAAAGSAFAAIFAGWDPFRAGVAAVALSLVSQAGDLLESKIKRHFAVKDSGSIIPGHGGLFDRLDGLLAAAPTAVATLLAAGSTDFLWR